LLRQLDGHFAAHPELRPPLVIVVLSHIDLLRPVREWNPPYNIAAPDSAKAHTIRAAMNAVAADLDIDTALVVPVCLLPDRVYNVDEALVPLLVEILPDAKRTLLLRSLKTLREKEQWTLLGRQARATGRFLWQLGGQVLKKSMGRVLTEGKL
jgi:predicted GTPase